jgi:hypothetical protein
VLRETLFAVLGFTIAQGGVIAFFAWKRALPAYLECTWWNNFSYVGSRHRGFAKAAWEFIVYDAQFDIGLWIAGTAALIALARSKKDAPGSGAWILLLGTTGAGLATGSRYIQYYEPMIVPLSLGMGVAMAWLCRQATRAGRSVTARACFITLGVIPWLWPAYNIVSSLANPDGVLMHEDLAQFIDAETAAKYINDHTDPGEPILILGSEPQILYLAERTSCTRLIITYPLVGPYPYSKSLRSEFFRDFERCRPRYVIYCCNVRSMTEWGKDPAMELLIRPSAKLLAQSYDVEKEIQYREKSNLFLIYRRKGS